MVDTNLLAVIWACGAVAIAILIVSLMSCFLIRRRHRKVARGKNTAPPDDPSGVLARSLHLDKLPRTGTLSRTRMWLEHACARPIYLPPAHALENNRKIAGSREEGSSSSDSLSFLNLMFNAYGKEAEPQKAEIKPDDKDNKVGTRLIYLPHGQAGEMGKVENKRNSRKGSESDSSLSFSSSLFEPRAQEANMLRRNSNEEGEMQRSQTEPSTSNPVYIPLPVSAKLTRDKNNSMVQLPGNDIKLLVTGNDDRQPVTGNDDRRLIRGSEDIYLVSGNDARQPVTVNDTRLKTRNDGKQLITANDDRRLVTGNDNIHLLTGNGDRRLLTGNDNIQLLTGNGDRRLLTRNDNIQLLTGSVDRRLVTGNDNRQLETRNDDRRLVTGSDDRQMVTGSDDRGSVTGNDAILEEAWRVRMNQKRYSLMAIQFKRELRSTTGDFYIMNDIKFGREKDRIIGSDDRRIVFAEY